MKKHLLARLPAVCIMFTLILVSTAVLNILNGYFSAGRNVILVFLWLVFFQVADYLLSLIPFRTCRQYRLCSMVVNFLLALAAWYWMGWSHLNLWSILASIVNYLIFYKIAQTVLQALYQAKADEINQELELRRKESNPPPPPDP